MIGPQDYVVEALLGRERTHKHVNGKPVYRYLVLWGGYPVEECTWRKIREMRRI